MKNPGPTLLSVVVMDRSWPIVTFRASWLKKKKHAMWVRIYSHLYTEGSALLLFAVINLPAQDSQDGEARVEPICQVSMGSLETMTVDT